MKWLVSLAVVTVVAFAGCSSDDKPKQATPGAEESPQAGAPATPAMCPVEQDLCDFAHELEAAARDDRLPAYLPDPWPQFAEESVKMWAVTGNLPRLTTIGCPSTGGNTSDCSHLFAVALSSLPEGIEEQDGRGLVVFVFERRGQNGGPLVKAALAPPGERKVMVSGGRRGFCGQPVAPEGECIEFAFQRYSTGVPDTTVAPPPGKLPPLRQVYDATSKEITLGEPYAIRTGELWYFNYLCDACGPGPFPNLYRAYRAADGMLVVDDLKARTASLGTPVAFTAGWEAATAYLATCTEGNCYSLESGDSESEKPAVVYKTEDGGITWKRDGEIPALTSLIGVVGGEVLAATYEPSFNGQRFWFYPSGRELELPQGVSETVHPTAENRTILWRGESGTYYDGAGTPLFGPLFAEKFKPQVVVADEQYQHTYLQWSERPNTPTSWEQSPYYQYVARVDRDGQMRELYGLPGDTMWISGEFRRGGDKPPALFGRFRFGESKDYVRDVSFGAVLDLERATVHRFSELDAGRPDGSFAWMHDLVELPEPERGPQTGFLRVTGAGTCLNVRETPGPTGRVFTCLADDVLVGDFGLRQTVDGVEWAQVRTPGGYAAWAAVEFLK
jgi:hypothetical protein